MDEKIIENRIRLVEEHLQAENEHNLDAIMITFGNEPSFELNGLKLGNAKNIHDLYDSFGFGKNGSFSNIKIEVRQRHIGNESIILEIALSGKHTGNFQGIAATNQDFEIPACAIFEFDAEEKIAVERVYFDGALLLQQLGVFS